jgi:hypothetical protein
MAREQWCADDDPLIAAAGRLWRPYPPMTPKSRRWVAEIETELRKDADRWKRYQRLKRELRSWNSLESSVALGAAASGLAVMVALGWK